MDDEVVTDVPECGPVYQYRTWSAQPGDPGMECTSTGFCFLCHTFVVQEKSHQASDEGCEAIYDEDQESDEEEDDDSIQRDVQSVKGKATMHNGRAHPL